MDQTPARNARISRAAAVVMLFTMAYAAPSHAQTADIRRFDLRLENGRLAESQTVITVKRNDRVEIAWRTDKRVILHLHGYDIEVTANPGKPETMAFTARATGRYAIESHAPRGDEKSGGHTILIYLEVHPR